MDLGFLVQMYLKNNFIPPLEASKGLETGLKSVQTDIYIYENALFKWIWVFIYLYKAYLHYGPLVVGLNVPLKHLFTTSGVLERALR